jgi:hypothetical protein
MDPASLLFIGTCFFSGHDKKACDYLSFINEGRNTVVQEVNTGDRAQEPHPIQTSLASSLISQIEISGNMPMKF